MRSEQWSHWWKSSGERELQALLLAHWDPIGIRNEPGAQDEYDAYLGGLGRRLHDGAGRDAVAEYLADVEREQMGFATQPHQLKDAAQRVVDWYASRRRS